MSDQLSRYLSRKEAAEYLGQGIHYLNDLATRRQGPPYSRPSHKVTLYKQSDIDHWLAEHLVPLT